MRVQSEHNNITVELPTDSRQATHRSTARGECGPCHWLQLRVCADQWELVWLWWTDPTQVGLTTITESASCLANRRAVYCSVECISIYTVFEYVSFTLILVSWHDLPIERFDHNGWASPKGIMLIGGYHIGEASTEIRARISYFVFNSSRSSAESLDRSPY